MKILIYFTILLAIPMAAISCKSENSAPNLSNVNSQSDSSPEPVFSHAAKTVEEFMNHVKMRENEKADGYLFDPSAKARDTESKDQVNSKPSNKGAGKGIDSGGKITFIIEYFQARGFELERILSEETKEDSSTVIVQLKGTELSTTELKVQFGLKKVDAQWKIADFEFIYPDLEKKRNHKDSRPAPVGV